MVIPFSNTHLRVPKGFQSLLVGLSTEVLRSQPRNIHQFAAEYFEKLLQRREQTQTDPTDRQTSLEDRYYNNPSFQHEYQVNDAGAHDAAKKIQTSYRNHRARHHDEKTKDDDVIDADQEDLGYGRQHSATPTRDPKHKFYDVDEPRRSPTHGKHSPRNDIKIESDQEFPPENDEEERQEQERAARIIQTRFRGSRNNTNEQKSPRSSGTNEQQRHHDFDHEKSPSQSSTRLSGKLDSDRHDLGGNLTANDQENSENEYTDRPGLEREPTQLSEDFERHTQVPRDSAFEREHQTFHQNENDMDHSDLDKAATRIQASYRGYRIRKELHSSGSIDHSHQPLHDEYEHDHNKKLSSPTMEQHKDTDFDEDDNAAAVKIQAAFRGYRARKDLEK